MSFYIQRIHIASFLKNNLLVSHATAHVSAPVVTHMRTVAAVHWLQLTTTYAMYLYTVEFGSVCGELCAVQGYFLLLVNILDLGVHRWQQTMDWNPNKVLGWEAGTPVLIVIFYKIYLHYRWPFLTMFSSVFNIFNAAVGSCECHSMQINLQRFFLEQQSQNSIVINSDNWLMILIAKKSKGCTF